MVQENYTIIEKKNDINNLIKNSNDINKLMINNPKIKVDLSLFKNLTNLILHDYQYNIHLSMLNELKYLLINGCQSDLYVPENIKLNELIIYNYSKKINIVNCSELNNVEMENCSSKINFYCHKLKLDTYRNNIILPNKIKELTLTSNDIIDHSQINVFHDNNIEKLVLCDYTGFIDIKQYKKINFLEINCMEYFVNYESIIPDIYRLKFLYELTLLEVEPIKISSESLKKLTIFCNDHVDIDCKNLESFTGQNKMGFDLTKCFKLTHLCCDIISVEKMLSEFKYLEKLELINVKNNYINLSNCYFLKYLKFIRGESCFKYNINNCINIIDISFENMIMYDEYLKEIMLKLDELKRKRIAGLYIKNKLKNYIIYKNFH